MYDNKITLKSPVCSIYVYKSGDPNYSSDKKKKKDVGERQIKGGLRYIKTPLNPD